MNVGQLHLRLILYSFLLLNKDAALFSLSKSCELLNDTEIDKSVQWLPCVNSMIQNVIHEPSLLLP